MSRINIPSKAEAPAESQGVLDSMEQTLGFVPNLQRLMALSPAVLNGWASLTQHLTHTLDLKTRNGIALAVTEVNGCDYCMSVHNYVASDLAHMTREEIELNRDGKSSDPKRAAAVLFAKQVVEKRGKVSGSEFDAVRRAGYSDKEILEIIGLAGLFLFTNFMNNVNDTEIDFPVILAKASADNAQPGEEPYDGVVSCGLGG